MKEIEYMISQFIDNELSATDQQELFEILKNNPSARKTLRRFIEIEKSAAAYYQYSYAPGKHRSAMNGESASRIEEKQGFDSMRKRRTTFAQKWITKPIPVYVNYLLGVVIIFIILFSFYQIDSVNYELNNYKRSYVESEKELQLKNNQINFILNCLPEATVTQKSENLVVVKAKI